MPKLVNLSSQPTIQRSKSLYEQVYTALRASILSGELPPGDRLVETQLADWLRVSRTPLREALRQLQQDGLVTADTGGGLRVATISAEDAVDLYDCRLALEQAAAVGACSNATSSQVYQLELLVHQAEKVGQGSSRNLNHIELLDLDYQFHHLIAESSGNRRLVSLLDQLFDSMALLRLQTLQHNPDVLDIRLEHRQIYEAVASRDPALAIAAITGHLAASKVRVVQEIENSRR